MQWFNSNSKYDFMGWRKFNALFSLFLILVSLSGLVVKGLNWGLDFTGGTQVEMTFVKAANLESIRQTLKKKGQVMPK